MWKDSNIIIDIFNKAVTNGTKFPCQCPVCQSHTAHVYVHRHNDKHCGIWAWCSECGSSSHMSSETPNWWINPDFVDATQLCSEPSYLDNMSDKIDEWTNSLIPTEGTETVSPFVMENRFDVVLTDELQGMPTGTSGTIVIRDDFKTVKVDFIDATGKAIRIDIAPEKLIKIIKVIDSADNR